MPFVDAYGQRKQQEAYNDAWGHLRPKEDTQYRGFIVFTYTAYSETVMIDWDFGELLASPWQCQDFIDFLCEFELEVGVYRFVGTYQNRELKGTVVNVPIEGV